MAGFPGRESPPEGWGTDTPCQGESVSKYPSAGPIRRMAGGAYALGNTYGSDARRVW